MGTDGSSHGTTLAETLAVFEGRGKPGEPLTATEVAAELDCSRATAADRLTALADRGDLQRKETGTDPGGLVWWREGTGRDGRDGGADRDGRADGVGRAGRAGRDDADRIAEVIRDVDRSLVSATSRPAMERAVCERLADSDPYTAASVVERTADETFRTRVAVGVEERVVERRCDPDVGREYEIASEALETRTVRVATRRAAGSGDGDTLAARVDPAHRNDREDPALRNDRDDRDDRVDSDDRKDAVTSPDRPVEGSAGTIATDDAAVAVVPLVYEDDEFGVLAVYANDPAVFDDRTSVGLEEVGETTAHAIAARRYRTRERRLTALHDASRRLVNADSYEEAGEVVVDAVTEDLGMDDAHVYRFDTERNTLEQVSTSVLFRSQAERSHTLTAADDSPVWSSFVAGETTVRGPDASPILAGQCLQRRTEVLVPFGNHGVLVAATDDADGLDRDRHYLLDMLAATAEAALDHLDSQAALRERDAALQERNRYLQRLNQVNTVIRDIDQALVRATTDEEIQRVVCEELTRDDRFRFAWIGEANAEDDRLLPRAWSGEGRGYLDSAGVESVCPVGEPAGRAFEAGEVTVVSNVADDLRAEPWRSEAFSREFQSVISVPLTYGDVTHGVLSVYATRPDVFGEMERSVFGELGRTIANAINAVETKRALLNDQMVELEFSLAGDSTSFLTRLAVETDSDVTFEGAVPVSDEAARVFFTARGASADDVRAAVERFVTVDSTRLVSSEGEGHLFEAVVSGSPVPLTLLDHDATLLGLTASASDARLVVGLPSSTDVRHFIERLLDRYEGAEFVARRERENPVQSREGFRFELGEELTDRQLEVLKTAYLSGYFASPRASTGSELGETLDISQPTVTEHLRAAQGKLLDLLFADDPTTT